MPDNVKYQRYLGDDVYASVTNGLVKLHTMDGHIIWFRVDTIDAFLAWLTDMRASMIADREKKDV